MTVMDYVARFTELACFADDYVATDMAKVERFKNGLKLSIRGRVVGLRLQDMDSMVGTALNIEREIEDARYMLEEPVSVSRSYAGTSRYTGRLERPEYGPRQRTRPIGRDVRGLGACLRHHTIS